jgi:hypothetical protein
MQVLNESQNAIKHVANNTLGRAHLIRQITACNATPHDVVVVGRCVSKPAAMLASARRV